MTKGLLKKLALGTAIAGSALFYANEVNAAPYNWGGVSDIVNRNVSSADYSTSNMGIVGANNGLSLPSDVKWSVLYLVDMGDGLRIAGGLDGVGSTGSGFINARKDTIPKVTGFYDGQTANYPGDSVIYMLFVDSDKDGDYGTYDKTTRQFIPDQNDLAGITSVTGFDSFYAGQNLSAGFLSGTYSDVPEPTTGGLLALGIAALALRRRKPTDKQSSKYHK